MISCPTCETPYAEELSHCPVCEEEMEEVIVCERCREEYRGGDSCPSCGALRVEQPCDQHPDRTAEGRCVICGRAVCAECAEGEHHAYLCPEHRTIPVIEGWAQVYSTTGEFEAQLVRDNLQAEGIDAQVYSQRDRVLSFDLGELSIVRILVPAWEYGQALRVIREHMDTEGEIAFACPNCGEPHEPGATECMACGASLV